MTTHQAFYLAIGLVVFGFLLLVIRAFRKGQKKTENPNTDLTTLDKSTTIKRPGEGFWKIFGSMFHNPFPDKGIKFANMAEFFAWFAGADLEIWRVMPSPVRKKRTTFGMLVFFSVAVSALLAGDTWGDIFHSTGAGVFIGIVWFQIIWSLDRAVIVYMDNNTGNRAVVAGRFAIIFAVAFINTTFIAMKIFNTEINTFIAAKKDAQRGMVTDSIANVKNGYQMERDAEYASLTAVNQKYVDATAAGQKAIDDQRAIIKARRDELIGEVEGNVGSGKKGYGDAAKTKQAMLAEDEATLQTLIARYDETKQNSPEWLALQDAKVKYAKRDAQLLADIAKADAFLAGRTETITNSAQDGYADRSQALWGVAKGNKLLMFMVFVFFFTFESMSVLMKIMGGTDNYDEALRLIKLEHSVNEQQLKAETLQGTTNGYESRMNGLLVTAIDQKKDHANAVQQALANLATANSGLFSSVVGHINAIDATVFLDLETGEKVKARFKDNYLKSVFNTTPADKVGQN